MKNTVKGKELWKFYENLALWCTTKIHRRDSPRMNRSLVERWGRLYRKMWRLRYDPGRQADETFEEVKAQIVKILEYHYRGLGLCYRRLREHFKERMKWNQEIHSSIEKVHQRAWVFLLYVFYFEYIRSVKGVETDSSQTPLNTAKYLSWKNKKHF